MYKIERFIYLYILNNCMEQEIIKTIVVSQQLHKKLHLLKIEKGFNNINDLIESLLN